MKIGLGLYRKQLTDANFAFARQLGATHLVVHLVDYFPEEDPRISSGGKDGWGHAGNTAVWSLDSLKDMVASIRAHGLDIAAIENFDPTQWSDILLDGPDKRVQIDALKRLIEDIGRAGIPCIGYNFSPGGVWGWQQGRFARGGSVSVGFDATAIDPDEPMPDGMVWNMRYRARRGDSVVGEIDADEMWRRLDWFLSELIPVAEASGVALAIHPEDPPVPSLRGIARILNPPENVLKLMTRFASPAHKVELCLGTVQEMAEGQLDAYQLLDRLLERDQVGYIHLRNVRGKVPHYREVFIDEGDLDVPRVIDMLHRRGYQGVVVPDHTPALDCHAGWHAGMAYAIGYIRALAQAAEMGRLEIR